MKRILNIILLFVLLSPLVAAPVAPESRIQYAGARSSNYGIKPFPSEAEWEKYLLKLASYFPHATPCAVWIVGVLDPPQSCLLEFPSPGPSYPNTVFSNTDKHEAYLSYFDQKGIKVYLQVEPANADVLTLIDLVLNRYKHHPCVIGFGIDVEWYREIEIPTWGVQVDDQTAALWEKRVKAFNPHYRLFLKHWNRLWMPRTYRGDILFVSDSQQLPSLEKMLKEFASYWADYFYPNPVAFQIGYQADQKWWQKISNPPQEIGLALSKRVKQAFSIFWVDFTLRQLLPDIH